MEKNQRNFKATMYWEGLAITVAGSGAILAHQYRNDLTEPTSLTRYKAKSSKTSSAQISFYALRQTYVIGFTIMTLADWLQGPFLLPMYSSFGLSNSDVAALYAIDYVVGIAAGLASGGWTDAVGAKKACVAYGILYAMSCLCNHFSEVSMAIVAFGCAMDGLCNALLRTSFETWIVAVCKRRKFTDEWSLHASAVANWWGAVASVLAGILCHALVRVVQHWGQGQNAFISLSFIATMDAAALLLLVGALFIGCNWEDDRSYDKRSGVMQERPTPKGTKSNWLQGVTGAAKEAFSNLQAGYEVLRHATAEGTSQSSVRAIVFMEVAFEATLMLFIGIFPMTITAVDGERGAQMMGVVFVSLMGSILLGTSLANMTSNMGLSAAKGWRAMCGLSVMAAATLCWVLSSKDKKISSSDDSGSVLSTVNITFLCLCLFEVCFGFYYPYLTLIHNAYTSEGVRNSCVSIVRACSYAVALVALCGLWLTNDVLICWVAVLLTTGVAAFCSLKI